MKRHPEAGRIALYAGGELPLPERLAIALHVRRCGRCRKEVERVRQLRQALREDKHRLPDGLDWAALEAEMKANIRLGIMAGALVRSKDASRPESWIPQWKPAAVVAATLAVVLVAGRALERTPRPAPPAPAGAGIVLRSTPEGLAVDWGGNESVVFGAGSAPVAAAVSWDGGARAPFLDEDTGQVTIYNVAAQ